MTKVSLAALAKHLDFARQFGSVLVKQGIIKGSATDKYDLDLNRVRYIRHLREKRATKTDGESEFRELKNQKLKIELALLDGSAIELTEAEAFYDALIASFRNALHGLGSRLSRDAKEKARIDTVTHAILTSLSEDFSRQFDTLRTTGKLPDDDTDDGESDGDKGDETDDPISRPHAN